MKRLFVTATDTGVGKTTVACALAALWRRYGRRVAVMKPVETGCTRHGEDLVPADATRLSAAAESHSPIDDVCPYRFELPASPEAAAAEDHRPIQLPIIRGAAARLVDGADILLVEGAGGLLAPLTAELCMADVAADLGCTLLVVARASLGTINHTLLTLEAARHRHLPVAGVVLNRPVETAGPDEATNPSAIARHGRVQVFGTLPHLDSAPSRAPFPPASRLADLAEQHLDLQALWQAI